MEGCQTGHPHAGGEIHIRVICRRFRLGPSPRGWGNLFGVQISPAFDRAIPTRVGKSRPLWRESRNTPGHPHAGGEITVPDNDTAGSAGPSPRGWGNLLVPDRHRSDRRAIPTRVGKSLMDSPICCITSGHPHAGGEIRFVVSAAAPHPGPSPRGWGNLWPNRFLPGFARAIPTRVGKSTPSRM